MTIKDLIKIKGHQSDLIRLGPNYDSGYVVNNASLISSDVLYTYGVGGNYEFEINYFNLFTNKLVRMFDPTIGELTTSNPSIKFYIDGLYATSEDNTSFQEHILKYGDADKNIFLKIDTEGAEYDFFKYVDMNKLKNVTGMVVEFHELHHENKIDNFILTIRKLLEFYDIVHVHGNNYTPLMTLEEDFKFPSTPEISFLRKDLNTCKEYSIREFPLENLDYPNSMNSDDYSFVIYN